MVNGSHTESLSLGIFGRYADFLDLYVGRRVPTGFKTLVAPQLAASLTGVAGLKLPQQNVYSGMTYPQAKHLYQSQPHVRVQYEEGAAAGQPSGSPLPRFVRGFDSWPVPSRKPTRFYLRSDGALSPSAATRNHAPAK